MSPNTICNCKICRNNLADIVNSKADDNISILDIKKYLSQNHKLEVTENVIKRHLKAYGIEIDKNVNTPPVTPSEVLMSVNQGVINGRDEIIIDLNNIDLDKYDFDKNDLMSVTLYLQKIHLGLYLKQAEITYKELSEYQLGIRDTYPNVAVNNLRKLFDLNNDTMGIKRFIDINSCIARLENEGYEISGGEEIEETTNCENDDTILENDDLENDKMELLKQTHKILKGILKNAGKPLTLEGIQLRLTDKDKMIKHHLIKELDMMIDMGAISRKDGYYSLIREEN